MATNPQPAGAGDRPDVHFPFPATGGSRYHALPQKSADKTINVLTTQTIRAGAEQLYALWRDLERLPSWQELVVSVTPLSDRRSHWVLGDPDDPEGKRFEFDSEITEDVPGKSIGWSSVSDNVDLSGRVTFDCVNEERGTRVTLLQKMKVPGGLLGHALLGAAVRSPEQLAKENLRHFKQLAETGEIPSVHGQPHGPRGAGGAVKRWLYGETNPTPPGTSRQS